MPSYADLANKKNELIRKGLEGSVFGAPITAPAIGDLTTYAAGPPVVIDLTPLPAGWDDFGWITTDGAQFSRDTTSSDVNSWGSNTPTRTDITADTTTLSFTMQETKALTIGIGTGADVSGIVPDAQTGEVVIAKPAKPSSRHYRILSLAVDQGDFGEIYIARFLPRAKVSSYAEQTHGGEAELQWGVTVTGEIDSTLGYSESYLFGGAGWLALLDEMGFDTTP
jgi:hypothetical protein